MGDVTHLYCPHHGTVHRFTRSEVERMVYALIAEVADAESLPADPADPFLSAHDRCPRQVLAMSSDAEGYYEHTAQWVAARRSLPADGVSRGDR